MKNNKCQLIGFVLFSFLSICTSNIFAVTYYSKTSGGNWNDASAWSTTGYGQATNTGTYPKSTDVANIGDGYTLIINATLSVGTINLGQGTSGIIEYGEAGNYSFSILNSLTINSGAKFWYNGNCSRTHTLNIGTNLTNSGTFDLYADADDFVNLVFYRNVNSIISGSGTYDLNVVTINKSSSTAFYADVQSSSFESAIRDFVVTYGTFNHNNSGTFNVNASAGSGFTIGMDAIIKITQGTVNLSPNQDETTLSGTLILNGGSIKIGSSTGVTGLRYDKVGSLIPKLDIQSGTMEVYGSIYYKSGASADPLNFNMSGGTLKLNSGSTGSTVSPLLVNDVTGSSFIMNDGIVTIQSPNTTGSSISDFKICGSSGTVSIGGGTVEFGNANTSSGVTFNFTPFSSVVLPNIKVTGSNASSITLKPETNSTANIKLISLYVDVNKTFDVRSISGTTGDSRNVYLSGNMDGINALFTDGNYISRSSTLVLQGGEPQQIAGSEIVTVYNFNIDNNYGVTLNQELDISNNLSLTNGIIYTANAYPIVLLSGATSDVGSISSYVEGTFNQIVATTLSQTLIFPIGKDGAFRLMTLDVTHNTSASVTYSAEMFNNSPRNLNYSLPSGVDKVSNVRYFQLNRSGASNLSSVTISLNYDADDGVNDYQYLRVVRDNGSNAWIDAGGVGSGNSAGLISSSSFSGSSTIFTLGNAPGGTNTLPVKFVSFNASPTINGNNLNWTTASEKNALKFEIQKINNTNEFVKIGEVHAYGNSNQLRNYLFNDPLICNKPVYYRLKQIDFDGKFEFSNIIVVNPTKFSNVLIYPNPGRLEDFMVNTQGLNSSSLKFELLDLNGTLLSSSNMEANGLNQKLPFKEASNGNYLVRIANGDTIINQQIVVVQE